jgi:hypothetical protein
MGMQGMLLLCSYGKGGVDGRLPGIADAPKSICTTYMVKHWILIPRIVGVNVVGEIT